MLILKKEKLMKFSDLKTGKNYCKEKWCREILHGRTWKKLNDGPQLNSVLEMIKEVKSLGLEACVTLGSVNYSQAKETKRGRFRYFTTTTSTPHLIFIRKLFLLEPLRRD